MAAEWYEKGLERMLDALETTDCRAAAKEVLTRKLGRYMKAADAMRIEGHKASKEAYDAAKKEFLEGSDGKG